MDEVFYFGYDEKAHTCSQILHTIAAKLLSKSEYGGTFAPMPPAAQQTYLVRKLRAKRHLLILDNLESITGEPLSIPHTLPDAEQKALHRLLQDLAGGATVVLLGSRSAEDWLASGTFDTNRYDLPGLDPESASELAEKILKSLHVPQYRETEAFERLLRLLDGYPLALEVVLANLSKQTPQQIVDALESGDVTLDNTAGRDKTESILQCIAYSHSNLDPDAQNLLLCLAPFTSVFFTGALEGYTDLLKQQPNLSHLPFDRFPEAIDEAIRWGLLRPMPEIPEYLNLQPTFPYFLRSKWNAPGLAEMKQAIETAFRLYYGNLGGVIANLMASQEAEEKQAGRFLARLEYENLITALNLALASQVSILKVYMTLTSYLSATHDESRGLELGKMVLSRMKAYSEEKLVGPLGYEFAGVLNDIANRQLLLKQFSDAEASYQQTLKLLLSNRSAGEEIRRIGIAGIHHQLGYVAQEQRQWTKAEDYFQQALQNWFELNQRSHQATTLHHLGRVAEGQTQWKKAEGYFRQALQIRVELNDRYSQSGAYHQLGIVAQAQHLLEQAVQNYEQALQIKREFNDRYDQASTLYQLGRVFEDLHQWEQAEQYYGQALQIRIEFNDRYEQARIYASLGIVAIEKQQGTQAREYFLRAFVIFAEYDDQHEMARNIGNLALLWRASPEAEVPAALALQFGWSVAEAETVLRQALGEAEG